MKKALTVASTAFQLGLIPFAAWSIAHWINSDALLVGPYLLLSPMIAFAIGGFIFMASRWRIKDNAIVSEDLSSRATALRGEPSKDVPVKLYEDLETSMASHAWDGSI